MIWLLISLLLTAVAYVGVVLIANKLAVPPASQNLTVYRDLGRDQSVGEELAVITWNLGYAGLGEQSNFKIDGGEDLLPPSRNIVRKNLAGIQGFLEKHVADIYFFQEVALPSALNYRVDVYQGLADHLAGYSYVFHPKFKTRLIPPPMNIEIGNAVFASFQIDSAKSKTLPLGTPYFYFFREHYNMIVVRSSSRSLNGDWVFVNIHLSAFDDQGRVREQQLLVLKEFMLREYEKGNYVVVGGDWNMRLTATDFSHKTDQKFLFWICDMPAEFMPKGWQLAIDNQVPSVRTVHQAYVPGDNYTTIIDGFVVSPNVRAIEVKCFDLQFRYTDHHPVMARFAAGMQ